MATIPEGPYPFEWIPSLFRPSIRLVATRISDAEIPVGTSKMGGLPDLASPDAWPSLTEDIPRSFLAQFNCADLCHLDQEDLLPTSGFLYLWGEWHDWMASYSAAAPSQLTRQPAPAGSIPAGNGHDDEGCYIYHSCSLRATSEYNLPALGHPSVAVLGLTEEQQDRYCAYKFALPREPYSRVYGGTGPYGTHKLLGYGDGEEDLEGDAESTHRRRATQVALLSNDIDTVAGANNWILLAQIDSDDMPGMMWSDVGTLWYMIRRQGLQARHFDDVTVVFQCG